MNQLMTTQQLRDELAAHLDSVTPPPGDLDAVRRRSRAAKVRRIAGPGLLGAAAVGIGALVLTQTTGPSSPDRSDDNDPAGRDVVVATEDPLDLSEGLRAYISPDGRLYLGGTSVDLGPEGVDSLPADAVATPYGLVYMDAEGRTQLLGENGRSEPLAGRSDTPPGWHPTARVDAEKPHVVFARMRGEDVDLTVYDLEKRSVVATYGIRCSSGCVDLVIDGIDSGTVFVRMASGTMTWNYETDESYRIAGRETRVADVRNGVILYDGEPPSENVDDWRLVPGAIDALLTFDGEHVLSWSSTLEPTREGGQPIVLDRGPANGGGLAWWTVDTDGSILVAVAQPDKPGGKVYTGDNIVYDCELPSGRCEELGPLVTSSGDPHFVGNDM